MIFGLSSQTKHISFNLINQRNSCRFSEWVRLWYPVIAHSKRFSWAIKLEYRLLLIHFKNKFSYSDLVFCMEV
jgi:hypothetical protein